MKNNNFMGEIAYNAICQSDIFEHCQNTLEILLSDVFEKISFDKLNYFVKSINHMTTIANETQKHFCNVQLERVTTFLYRLLQENDYKDEEISKIIDILSSIQSVYYAQNELVSALEVQKTIAILIEKIKTSEN